MTSERQNKQDFSCHLSAQGALFLQEGTFCLFSQPQEGLSAVELAPFHPVPLGDAAQWRLEFSGGEHFTLVTLRRQEARRAWTIWDFYLSADHPDASCHEICFPFRLTLEEEKETLLPLRQGLVIPAGWPQALKPVVFEGQLGSCAAVLPCWAKTDGQHFLCMSVESGADARYDAQHDANEQQTPLSWFWLPQNGSQRKTHHLRLVVGKGGLEQAVDAYALHARQARAYATNLEKKARFPKWEYLARSPFYHWTLFTNVCEDSIFYKEESANQKRIPISTWEQEWERQANYFSNGYIHFDGWGKAGYDREHPRMFPVNEACGGAGALAQFIQRAHEQGWLVGLHDQYRDYYMDSPDYHPCYAIEKKGQRPSLCAWAGGKQEFLDPEWAQYFLLKNLEEAKEQNLDFDVSYLDVFTCNPPDENDSAWHHMTREECLEGRLQLFRQVGRAGKMPTSEEVGEWALQELVSCHYAPYEFQMHAPGTEEQGIPYPFFNRVWHDCLLIPWRMEIDTIDHGCYALLNGGLPYAQREAAYPGIDGAFSTELPKAHMQRCQEVLRFAQEVKFSPMISFWYDPMQPHHQKAEYENGFSVEIHAQQGWVHIYRYQALWGGWDVQGHILHAQPADEEVQD